MNQKGMQFDMLLTDRILRDLAKGNPVCDMLGGCMRGIEWSGVLLVVREGKALNKDCMEDMADALACRLPLAVLQRAVDIAEKEEETGL